MSRERRIRLLADCVGFHRGHEMTVATGLADLLVQRKRYAEYIDEEKPKSVVAELKEKVAKRRGRKKS
ncbi:hypothetical protein [Rhodopirellula sp. MGV]|uniref:hypothetical protein n=1 Tax=Rhodopirellula sp. MGV TaxID=2023130 RepID=UPI000B9722F3|nr:hypothetical protein [Rhodopirellula sp. MGV]OYP38898.1 hypothetical protein CGZ80_01375 [Rhodopirellula sp. MGV]PNY38288.1 hypothetical protein C2E31_02960 [Rhodopirellula baltica]